MLQGILQIVQQRCGTARKEVLLQAELSNMLRKLLNTL